MLNKILDEMSNLFKTANKYSVNGKEFVEVKLIGEGGYGYVFVVIEQSSGSKFALKKMNITSREAMDNVRREIELWTKINNHNNIIKLIDYEIRDKTINIVMELCHEGTLLDFINNTTSLIPEKLILNILDEIYSLIRLKNLIPLLNAMINLLKNGLKLK